MSQIDDHIAAATPDVRPQLERLRSLIAAAAPEATEGWSYGVPAFIYRGKPLVAFAGAKGHASFFPMSGELVERHAAELAGYSTAKGTIRLTARTGVPDALVTTIVRERISQLDAKLAR